MALKKSDLYASLWASCDELRNAMEPAQYKNYVLVMLFIKYVSDKYAGTPYAPITVPKGSSFEDLVKLKGSGETSAPGRLAWESRERTSCQTGDIQCVR